MQKFLSYVLIFYLGRLSYMVWENALLEDKRKRLHDIADEMCEYGNDLKRRELIVKEKYKEMIDTVAIYNAEAKEDSSKWDSDDDILMEQWSKADR